VVRRLNRPPWLLPLTVVGFFATAFGYVLAHDPTDDRADPLGSCLFREMTGLNCPGCGGTRMVWYLLHGDLVEAFRHHAFALAMTPLGIYFLLAWTRKRMTGTPIPWTGSQKFWIPVAVAFVSFVVLRNLPWEPFLWFRV